jgi:hypothetical protein
MGMMVVGVKGGGGYRSSRTLPPINSPTLLLTGKVDEEWSGLSFFAALSTLSLTPRPSLKKRHTEKMTCLWYSKFQKRCFCLDKNDVFVWISKSVHRKKKKSHIEHDLNFTFKNSRTQSRSLVSV